MNKITSTQKQIFSLLSDPHASHKIKRNLVNALDSQSIDKICEFILNVVNKNAPICAESRKKLLPQAKFCRRLLNKKISIKEKKRILIKKGIQKGGFLQFIIPAIISAIGGIISSVITSKAKETQE